MSLILPAEMLTVEPVASRDNTRPDSATSDWNLDWRQAFEEARQVKYSDWFGGTVPSRPEVARQSSVSANVTATSLMTVSLRQSMQPPADPPADSDAPAKSSEAVAGPTQTSSSGAVPSSSNAVNNESPEKNEKAGSTQPLESRMSAKPSPPRLPASSRSTVRMQAPHSSTQTMGLPTTGSTTYAGISGSSSTAAAEIPPDSTRIVEQNQVALSLNSIDAYSSTALSEIDPIQAASDAVPIGNTVLSAVEQEHESVKQNCPPSSSGLVAQAAIEKSDEGPRVHAEWTANGVKIWLGVDADGAQAGDQLEVLAQQLSRWLASSGEPLAELICNGRSVWRASSDSAPGVTSSSRGQQAIDFVFILSDLNLKEAS